MNKHSWTAGSTYHQFCFRCGLVCTPTNQNDNCPPWSNTSETPNSSKEDLDYFKTYRIVGTFLELAKAKEELQRAIKEIDKIMINIGDIPHA